MKCKGGRMKIYTRERSLWNKFKKKKQETHLRQEELTSTHFLFLSTYDIYFGSISRLTLPHMRTHTFYITTSRSLLYYLLNYILPVNRLFSGSYTSHMLLQQSAHGKLHAMHMRTHLVHLQPRQ